MSKRGPESKPSPIDQFRGRGPESVIVTALGPLGASILASDRTDKEKKKTGITADQLIGDDDDVWWQSERCRFQVQPHRSTAAAASGGRWSR